MKIKMKKEQLKYCLEIMKLMVLKRMKDINMK